MSRRGWKEGGRGGQQRGGGSYRGGGESHRGGGDSHRECGGSFREGGGSDRGGGGYHRGGGGYYRGGAGSDREGGGYHRGGGGSYRGGDGSHRGGGGSRYESEDDYRSQRGRGGGSRGDRGYSGGERRPYGPRGGRGQYTRDERTGGGAPFKASEDSGKFATSNQASTPAKVQLIKKGTKIMCRPSYGTAGRPIQLVSNYFKLKYENRIIYHYDIEIKLVDQGKKPKEKQKKVEVGAALVSNESIEVERKTAKRVCKQVFEKWVKSKAIREANPVYDGVKNVFTSEPLGFCNKTTFLIDLEENDKTRKYELTIQPVEKADGSNEIHLKSLLDTCEKEKEIIMALNCILNYRESHNTQVQVGQSFFYLTQPRKIEMNGLEVWFGHNQSVQSTEKGPAVLINLAAKAFHSAGPVIKYANDILRCDITRSQQPLKPYQRDLITDALKGVRVQVTHLKYPRKYIVEGVTEFSAKDTKLKNESLSVAQYFEKKYGRLKFPFLQCLHMKSNTNQTFIPFEHCVVLEAQKKMGKLDPFFAANMIKQTAIPPTDRFQAIEGSYRDVLTESGEKMTEYNLSLDSHFIKPMGRVLKRPSLGYSKSGTVQPDDRGVWDMKGNKFYECSINIESWILIDFADCSKSELDKFQNFFISAGSKVGLNFGQLLDIRQCGGNVKADRALSDAKRAKAAFVVIILHRKDRFHNYDEIKFLADYQLQLVNQCIDSKILSRFNDQIATNICLKINAKLGGINHILGEKPKILSDSVMIMGADAVHFARGPGQCPSIAAVVGSVDEHAFKYEIACNVQDNPDDSKISQELILNIRNMVVNLLRFYHKRNKKHPKKLIFFRDGVSEGQFQTVHDDEIPLVQLALRDVIGHIVPVTFIVVQKRHQTRFKPENPMEGVGRTRNIPPGTAVDTDVVHPNRFDYFLNSHEGIQGTCKSARYVVLHDDSKFTSDELQQLTYHLCYTYNKCNRSISIPAPVKYADLACFRAKNYADFHMEEEKRKTRQKHVALPNHAREAIDRMGECGNSFFFL